MLTVQAGSYAAAAQTPFTAAGSTFAFLQSAGAGGVALGKVVAGVKALAQLCLAEGPSRDGCSATRQQMRRAERGKGRCTAVTDKGDRDSPTHRKIHTLLRNAVFQSHFRGIAVILSNLSSCVNHAFDTSLHANDFNADTDILEMYHSQWRCCQIGIDGDRSFPVASSCIRPAFLRTMLMRSAAARQDAMRPDCIVWTVAQAEQMVSLADLNSLTILTARCARGGRFWPVLP